MSGKKAFGKFRKLVVVTTIAGLGAMMSAAGCCGSSCNTEPSCNTCATPCGDCANWDYAHGGTRQCGTHSCGGRRR